MHTQQETIAVLDRLCSKKPRQTKEVLSSFCKQGTKAQRD